MKFERDKYRQIIKEITWGPTPRRIAAAKRALQRQRDKLPLFADEIAVGQPSPEERIAHCDAMHLQYMRRMRSLTAQQWRRGRSMLREMPGDQRAALLDYWNNRWSGPKRAEYFCDLAREVLRKIDR